MSWPSSTIKDEKMFNLPQYYVCPNFTADLLKAAARLKEGRIIFSKYEKKSGARFYNENGRISLLWGVK